MSVARPVHSAQDLVPLEERLRWFWGFRLAAVALVPLFAWLVASQLLVSGWVLAATTAGYLGLSWLLHLLWRASRRRLLRLFVGVLILDALYLAFVAYAAGDSLSPLRYLTVVHLVVVALLASYRTGLRLALWHSVLAFAGYLARDTGALGAAPLSGDGGEYRALLGFVVLFWLITLATVTFSAINERELRRRRYDLEALARFSDAVESAQSPEAVADALAEHLADAFGMERLLVLAGPREVLSPLATRGRVGRPASVYVDAPGSAVRRALDTRRTVLTEGVDPVEDPWLSKALPKPGNLLVSPLTSEARSIGVVVLEHSLRPGSRVERRVVTMIERFVAHASLALENAFLMEQLRRSASTDGLTGIANRRSFDITLDRYLARAVASFEPVSLVLLDIDHFKQLNDEHGHQTGDDVLRQVAALLVEHARAIDVPARYGGEEFAVVLPECELPEATVVAERLRQAIAAADLPVAITVSAGVATFPAHGATSESLIRATDTALYRAKDEGRNRIAVAAEPLPADGPVAAS
jgi:diguanylate cyclase (GGDEF)-like protein